MELDHTHSSDKYGNTIFTLKKKVRDICDYCFMCVPTTSGDINQNKNQTFSFDGPTEYSHNFHGFNAVIQNCLQFY